MYQLIRIALLSLVICSAADAWAAGDISGEQMRGLDEQVQEMKTDVLDIAAELGRLEERLLYPSGTQVALFVEIADGDALRLDAVQVEINGELVAHYIYSFKELEALQDGGVQRLYTGNIPTGEHSLSVTYTGKLKNGSDVNGSQQFAFVKGVEPKMLGITLDGTGDRIALGDW
ncbi:MAG TPA: hypothetical protein VFF18_15235 [Woeseiaceae bacterium]|nr:hypothetical protein [Woeseiaceae bacterium]